MRFSDFLLVSDPTDLDFIVGYTDEQNIRINVLDLFAGQIIGGGTPGYVPVFTAENVIDDSVIFQHGTNIVIGGVDSLGYKLAVSGSLYASNGAVINSTALGADALRVIAVDGDIFVIPNDSGQSISSLRRIAHPPAVLTTESATLGQLNTAISNLEEDIEILLDLKVDKSSVGEPNGVASLDATGKIPLSEIPDSIIGQVEYMGTWNAFTNTPTLNPLIPEQKGHYYVVSAAGVFGGVDYQVGDWIISNGVEWQKVDNTDAVTSVFGRIGAILALEADYQSFYPRLSQAYDNPTWINTLAFSKITGVPPFLLENQTITLSGDVTGSGKTSIASTISNNAVTDSKLRDSVGTSVIGRASSTTGDPADIQASTDGHVLQRSGGTLLFGLISSDSIGSIDWSKIINTPTTLSGYGITNAYTKTEADNKFVPYTGANANVNLGSNNITANAFAKAGGTSAQFLKADGSVDVSQYVPTTRSVNAGTGLTGGGNLSSDITLAFDTTWGDTRYAYRTREIIAGTGLLGGGDLSANRTLSFDTVWGDARYLAPLAGYVPYTGATTNVNLGEFGVRAGYVQLDTTPTSTPTAQGTIYWDQDDNTIDAVLNGYIMKIGEDQFYPVKNQTGSPIAKGTAVRFAGTVGASGRLLIQPFIADGSVPSTYFMGVTAETIADGADGKVLWFGRIRGINTNAYNEGDILYASTTVPGGFQTTVPVAPNNIVQVAAVITKHVNNGTIFIRPTLGSNINKDEGVKITSPVVGQLLQLQSGNIWENKSLGQVIGGLSSQFLKGDGSLDSTSYVPFARQITINGTTFDLSANRTWNVGTVTSVGLSVPVGFAVTNSPITSSGNIVLGFDSGYSLPTNAKQLEWDTAYANRIASLTTTGTSGAATFISNVLNIPQYQAQGNYITNLTGEVTANGPGSVSAIISNSAVIGKVLTGLSVTGSAILASDTILQAFGKLQGQVNGLVGGLQYQGTWNANTNTPTLTSGVGTDGHFYIVSVSGNTTIDGLSNWQVGDWIVFHTPSWQKVDNTESVTSVNGQVGAVNLSTTEIPEGTNLYFTNARSRQSISLTTTGSSGAATYNNSTGVFNIPQYSLSGLGGVPTTRSLTINGVTFDLSADRSWTVGDVRTDVVYTNPSFIGTLAWGKITGTPTTLSGYGITDAVPSSRTITINGVTQDLSANRIYNVGTVTSVTASSPLFSSGGTTPNITIQQASGSQNGFLSSTDWTTFNNKQNALTNPVTGTGNTNYLPKFTGSTTIGNSALQDDGTNVYIVSRELRLNRGTYSGFAFGIDQQSTFAFGSTNGKRVAIIYDSTAADNGLQFGYDTVDKTGIIAGAATSAGAGIDFYTYNGSAWGNRARVTASGNLLVGTTTDNGARLQVSGAATFSSNVTIRPTSGYNAFFQTSGTALRINYLNDALSANISATYRATDFGWQDSGGNSIFTLASTGAATFSNSVTATQFITGGTPSNTAGFTNSFYAHSNFPSITLSNTSTNTGKFTLGVTDGSFGIWNNATSSYPMFINSSNYVLIGTTTGFGDFKLQVNGNEYIKLSQGAVQTWSNSGSSSVNIRTNTGFNSILSFTEEGISDRWSIGTKSSDSNLYFSTGDALSAIRFTLSNAGAATFSSSVTAASFIRSGGTSSQYLMADGSVSTLSNPVTGTGTTNYLPKFTGSTTIGNSQIFDNGTNVGIGTNTPTANLEVYNAAQGNIYISSALGNASALRFFSGGNEYVTLRNLANGNFDIETGTGSPATRVRITSGGNLLVGTTTDNGARLQVSGTSTLSGNTTITGNLTLQGAVTRNINFFDSSNTNLNAQIQYDQLTSNTGQFFFGTNNAGSFATRLTIASTGAATFSSSVTARNATTAAALTNPSILGAGEFMSTGGLAGYFWENRSGGVTSTSNWYGWYALSGINHLYNGSSNLISINGSNGNLGVGDSNPLQKLVVNGGSLLVNTGTSASAFRDIMIGGIGGWSSGESHGIDTVYNTTSSPTTFSRIESHFDGTSGRIRFRNLFLNSAPRTDILMTIEGNGNVLIGTTTDSGARLQVSGNVYIARSSNPYLTIDDTGVNSEGGILFKPSGFNSKGGLTINYSTAEQRLFVGEGGNSYFQTFYTNGSERMRITSSGNLGLGVTPSAWGSLFNNSLLQVKTTSMLGYDNNLYLGVNYYATNSSDNYIQNGFASRYVQRIGQHQWETAPSGTANGAVTFTQAMTLTSGGNLILTTGTVSDNGARLQVSGRINAAGGGSNGVLVSSNSGSVTIPTTGLSLNTGFNVGYINNFNGGNYVDLYYGASKHIFDGGNLLVGTTTDNGARLQVSGTSTFSGELNLQYNNAIQTIQGNTGFSLIRLYGGNGSSSNVVEFQIRNRVDGGDFSTIGNFSNHDLQIRTNNTARLTIAGSTGAATFSSSVTTGDNVVVGNPNSSVFFGTSSIGYGTSPAVGRSSTNGFHIQNSIAGDLCIGAEYNKSIIFGTGASGTLAQRMRITSSGNVLIGTTTDTGSRLGIKSSGTNSFPLIVQRSANTNTLAAISETSGGDGSFLLANSLGSTNIQLLSNGTSILNGGNVLIGTTSDVGATLHVNGTIRTGAPSGGSAVNWRLGTARGGTVTTNATVRVEIDGVLVDLVARYV